ncbi:uncharacterized protein N7459_002054 [Penicillium hispanicum]|uniref:uncharacterized protein n=1 Tax=Penicillium hispanicum TaxID=1080232 RepID=UPI00253FAC69|nr:uncharacterized protein N7459_002054 [Penicillium hispanicum]KAJ5591685.1 hypothetical protein N7459_002054 [Penicillium hispanicum]
MQRASDQTKPAPRISIRYLRRHALFPPTPTPSSLPHFTQRAPSRSPNQTTFPAITKTPIPPTKQRTGREEAAEAFTKYQVYPSTRPGVFGHRAAIADDLPPRVVGGAF